jgi:hypothetical protein
MHEAGSDQGDAVWWEDNEYLIAGGVAGTVRVVICQRGDGGRNLTEFARNTDIPTRTSSVWAYLSVRAAIRLYSDMISLFWCNQFRRLSTEARYTHTLY